MAVNAATPNSGAAPQSPARNPGPSWGYQFLRTADRLVPEMIFKPARAMGTWIALARMPAQRRCSREYLATVLPRPPTLWNVFRHFFAFEESLMLRLRLANGAEVPCEYAPEAGAFREWVERGGSVLLGTFHIGWSDMLGFQLGGLSARKVHIVRQRVANSHDTEALAARYGEQLQFIWVNERTDLLFLLKEAAREENAIALQCDRPEFSARNEAFEFLGARRLFPFTIYHLALIFERPVILAVGVPAGPRQSRLHASPRFERLPGETKSAALARAREHFQSFLRQIEALLRDQPYLWFNFVPLNPVAPEAPAS
jgi:predicted LPLAT superfamily acyltransferase